MIWGRNGLSAALLLITVVYVWEGFSYKPTPRLFPLLVGIPMLVLTAFQTVIDIFPNLSTRYIEKGTVDAEKLAGKTGQRLVEEDPRQTQQAIEAFLWLGLAVGLSVFLGMFWGIPLFVFIFLKFRYATRWTISVGLPLGMLFVIYLLFDGLFHIPLYKGLLWE